jgi:hypothetical protein
MERGKGYGNTKKKKVKVCSQAVEELDQASGNKLVAVAAVAVAVVVDMREVTVRLALVVIIAAAVLGAAHIVTVEGEHRFNQKLGRTSSIR